MYCPHCGTEAQANVQYCRACGTDIKGPIPKVKEIVKTLKAESTKNRQNWLNFRKKKTAAERREQHITKGVVSLFSGAGLATFLYFLSTALVLKLPPHIVDQIPFEIAPVVRIIWLLGLLPATAGLGHIIAGLLIRQDPEPQPQQLDQVVTPPRALGNEPITHPIPLSVTDHTTNLLDERHKKAQTLS
ncbi:MAG TPA: zinc ribbon domain-containing protein [Pyrinomonadaceae bacterium]|nr:zinc ribbon domain-containing protein [Pyrinomonadaceae bacterium]